jgi:hypothetical protein
MGGIRRAVGAASICFVFLALPTAAGAGANAETFDFDRAGWDLSQVFPPSPSDNAAWSATAGNRGGAIQFTDTSSSGTGLFVSPPLGDHSAYYGGVLSYDLKTTATVDPVNYKPAVVFGRTSVGIESIEIQHHAALAYTTFRVPLALDESWVDPANPQGGTPVTTEDIQYVLGDPQLFVNSDFDAGTGDVATLDNVVFHPAKHPARDLTLAYNKKHKRLTAKIHSHAARCEVNQEVAFFKQRPGIDEHLGFATSDENTGARTLIDGSPGKYYAKVPRQVVAFAGFCGAAKSPVVKVG